MEHVLTILSLLEHLALVWNFKKRVRWFTFLLLWHHHCHCVLKNVRFTVSYLQSHFWCSAKLRRIVCCVTIGLNRITLKINRGHNKARFKLKQHLHASNVQSKHHSPDCSVTERLEDVNCLGYCMSLYFWTSKQQASPAARRGFDHTDMAVNTVCRGKQHNWDAMPRHFTFCALENLGVSQTIQTCRKQSRGLTAPFYNAWVKNYREHLTIIQPVCKQQVTDLHSY